MLYGSHKNASGFSSLIDQIVYFEGMGLVTFGGWGFVNSLWCLC